MNTDKAHRGMTSLKRHKKQKSKLSFDLITLLILLSQANFTRVDLRSSVDKKAFQGHQDKR